VDEDKRWEMMFRQQLEREEREQKEREKEEMRVHIERLKMLVM
jgi:hypothetical protein